MSLWHLSLAIGLAGPPAKLVFALFPVQHNFCITNMPREMAYHCFLKIHMYTIHTCILITTGFGGGLATILYVRMYAYYVYCIYIFCVLSVEASG